MAGGSPGMVGEATNSARLSPRAVLIWPMPGTISSFGLKVMVAMPSPLVTLGLPAAVP